MQSILVNARQKAAVVLSSLVETHAADVGKAIEHRLGAYLREGEVLPWALNLVGECFGCVT